MYSVLAIYQILLGWKTHKCIVCLRFTKFCWVGKHVKCYCETDKLPNPRPTTTCRRRCGCGMRRTWGCAPSWCRWVGCLVGWLVVLVIGWLGLGLSYRWWCRWVGLFINRVLAIYQILLGWETHKCIVCLRFTKFCWVGQHINV